MEQDKYCSLNDADKTAGDFHNKIASEHFQCEWWKHLERETADCLLA